MKIDKDKIERRTMKITVPEIEKRDDMEISGDPEEPPMIIEGYAVIFDQPQTYTFGDETYTEIIRRSALDNADMRRTVLRYNHEDSVFALARVKNGSLQMTIDSYGLKITAELIDTRTNKDAYKMIKAQLIDEMSFAFTVAENGDIWTYSDDFKTVTREITAIDVVYDVSIVDTGFYENTNVFARAFEGVDALKKEAEAKKLELEKARAIALAKA